MKCPQCDFENEEGSKFCSNCNISLIKPEAFDIKENPYIKIEEEDQPFELISDEEVKVKNKIEKEEKIRAEAKNKRTGYLVLLVLAIIVGFFIFKPSTSQKKETQPSSIHLNASVRFTETQFIIENNDNFDWLNVEMELNRSFLKGSGFILKTDRMKAGETYTVGTLQFAKRDGTRFNPFTSKPLRFNIYCDTPKGENAFWTGGWE